MATFWNGVHCTIATSVIFVCDVGIAVTTRKLKSVVEFTPVGASMTFVITRPGWATNTGDFRKPPCPVATELTAASITALAANCAIRFMRLPPVRGE